MADVKATDKQITGEPIPADVKNPHESFALRPHEVEAMERAKGAKQQGKIAEKMRADLDRTLTTIIPDDQKVSDAKDIPNQSSDVVQEPVLSQLEPKPEVEMQRTDPEGDKQKEEIAAKVLPAAEKTAKSIEKAQKTVEAKNK